MKLLTFSAQNFRGLNIAFDPQGHNVNIYGCNGAGKTSTEDAFLWLLFGKDSADRKDYDLIPHKSGGTVPDTGCGKEPVVEAKLEYFGKTVKLKKAYIEEWPKRGALKGQYAGSKTHYFVDGLETKAGEYNSAVGELIDPGLFKLLTNPHYFTESLSWQERRATLVKIAGDLNVEPVPDLVTLMDGRPFDNFHALAKQNVKAAQKKLDGMPYAISEAQRLIPTDLPAVPDVQALEKERDKLCGGPRRAAADAEAELTEARNAYTASVDAYNAKIKAGIAKLEDERRKKAAEADEDLLQAEQRQNQIDALSAQKAAKLAQWHEAHDRAWHGSYVCPTCGQKLPPEQVEAAREKFNQQKAEDLKKITAEGTALRDKIGEVKDAAHNLKEQAAALEQEISVLDQRLEKGRGMIKPYDFESTKEYAEITARIKSLKGSDAGTEQKISELTEKIKAAEQIELQRKQAAEQKKRVAELEQKQRAAAAELGRWEKAVALCEEHVKKQAHALETAVNGKFKIARFRMFAPQKNGEEAECCDVVYPNGSTNLSTGERLQTGIDIINTLSEYYGVDAPIWIDNREGITLPIEAKAQTISLIVSPTDKKLRIEVAGNPAGKDA
jgi:predicted  nucleic acid-binding Zn-ribbon protein